MSSSGKFMRGGGTGANSRLPQKLKCMVGGEWKDRSHFSNSQLRKYDGACRGGRQPDPDTVGLTCKAHRAGQPTEHMCRGPCNKWRALELFSKSSRRSGKFWCLACTEWQLSYDPNLGCHTLPTPAGDIHPSEMEPKVEGENLGEDDAFAYDHDIDAETADTELDFGSRAENALRSIDEWDDAEYNDFNDYAAFSDEHLIQIERPPAPHAANRNSVWPTDSTSVSRGSSSGGARLADTTVSQTSSSYLKDATSNSRVEGSDLSTTGVPPPARRAGQHFHAYGPQNQENPKAVAASVTDSQSAMHTTSAYRWGTGELPRRPPRPDGPSGWARPSQRRMPLSTPAYLRDMQPTQPEYDPRSSDDEDY